MGGADCTSCAKNSNEDFVPKRRKKQVEEGPVSSIDTVDNYEMPDMTAARKVVKEK